MNFQEILDAFKNEESAEMLMPLTSDGALCNGILAWQSIPIEYDNGLMCPNDIIGNKNLEWDWMWNSIKYDVDRFGTIVNCKKYEVNNLIMRLRSMYLIYPDGSVNKLAKNYMKTLVAGKMMKAQGVKSLQQKNIK